MARQNDTRLYGYVADEPQITAKSTGGLARALFHLAVIRSSRDSGEGKVADRIMYDWPIVLSMDEEMTETIASLHKYDVVDVKGIFVTKKIKKITYCTSCGNMNKVDGNICFVMPLFIKKRNGPEQLTEKQAVQQVIENREISNGIIMIGSLCQDVNYYHNAETHIQTSVYQVAVDRKFFVTADAPDIKTDFPVIRTYGKRAKKDSICLHTGSLVLVDGYLHSRRFKRTSECPSCNSSYEWDDNTIEIIPYASDYLANYTDPDLAREQEGKKQAEEGRKIFNEMFSQTA